ncbi:MAG: radical SAM protein [Magnetococcales bacterium]|nr:radical SAM protein [Magnetococcales bacterium]
MPPDAFLLQWHVTERCDSACAHCYQGPGGARELDWPEMMEALERLRALLTGWRVPARITLTGGDPWAREDFAGFLDRLAGEREWCSLAVLCASRGVDRAAVRQLARIRPAFAQLSVDGAPDTHDALRGAGDFARVERAVTALKGAGVTVVVAFTAHPGNAGDFPQVVRWAWRKGVDRLWTDRMLPLGRAADGLGEGFTADGTRRFFETVRRARDAWWRALWPRGRIAMHRPLQFLAGGGRPARCGAGERLLALLPDGTLLPCRRLPVPLGNILDPGGIARVYAEHPLVLALRRPGIVPDGCRGCLHLPWCRGGARCQAAARTGDPLRRDPGCWLAGDGEVL